MGIICRHREHNMMNSLSIVISFRLLLSYMNNLFAVSSPLSLCWHNTIFLIGLILPLYLNCPWVAVLLISTIKYFVITVMSAAQLGVIVRTNELILLSALFVWALFSDGMAPISFQTSQMLNINSSRCCCFCHFEMDG